MGTANDTLTLGTGLVAIEQALIAKGRHITDVAMWADQKQPGKKQGRWLFRISFDPPYHSTEEAFGSTWRGYTRLLTGTTPQSLLAQIVEMDVADQEG